MIAVVIWKFLVRVYTELYTYTRSYKVKFYIRPPMRIATVDGWDVVYGINTIEFERVHVPRTRVHSTYS
jgi:hypothetical protein